MSHKTLIGGTARSVTNGGLRRKSYLNNNENIIIANLLNKEVCDYV